MKIAERYKRTVNVFATVIIVSIVALRLLPLLLLLLLLLLSVEQTFELSRACVVRGVLYENRVK